MKKPDHIIQTDWDLLLERQSKNIKKAEMLLNKGYPIQYLIGDVEFYGFPIKVNKHVLIPRFETEYLVEKTINHLKNCKINNPKILEIGTGSGCIAIALKRLITCEVTALDKSKSALKLAKENALLNETDITFYQHDIFKKTKQGKYDVIISNPPYIEKHEEVDNRTKYEPRMALYAKQKGLSFYDRILSQVHNLTSNKNVLIALEIGYLQANDIKTIAKKYLPNARILVETDPADKDRYVFIFEKVNK